LLQISDAIDLDNGQRGDAFERTIGMLAEENGVGIDAGAANLLSMKCGDNFRLISQEIEKISTNIFGERSRISCSDVESLVDDYDSGNFFDPVEKFFEGDVLSALRAVDKYFFYNGDARPLLAAFQSRNRLLIQLQSLMKMGRIRIVGGSIARDDLSRVARALHMDTVGKSTFNVFSQNPWYLSKLARPCVLFKLQDLLKFQALFASIFLLISERNGEQKSVLRGMVVSGLTRIARRNFTQAHSYPA
jgi:DNA polymerase-3 subunit delta